MTLDDEIEGSEDERIVSKLQQKEQIPRPEKWTRKKVPARVVCGNSLKVP